MQSLLSWDIVLLSSWIVLFFYNFVLGKNKTVKFILSMYISVLTADAITTIFHEYIFLASERLQQLLGEYELFIFTIMRLVFFLVGIVIFTINTSFHIKLDNHPHWLVRLGILSGFSILSALFFLSTLLVYLSGNSFISGLSGIGHDWEQVSLFATILINHYRFWVFLPAVCFLITSFFFPNEDSKS